MSELRLTGPQQVSLAAERLRECPHSVSSLDSLVDISREGYMTVERLSKFACLKLLSDELAVRLPNMAQKLPPYGMPEFNSDYPLEADTPLKRTLFRLKERYVAKMDRHIDDELKDMESDTKFKPIMEANNLASPG